MGGAGLVLSLLAVLSVGTGVMAFKQNVDHERRRVADLEREVAAAHASTARLRAELAYHSRPDYLLAFAEPLGLVPTTPDRLTSIERLAERPAPVAAGEPAPVLVVLASGRRIALARRPAVGSQP